MIKIKKGNTILEVSNCAYKDIFKKQGYEIITDEKKSKKEKIFYFSSFLSLFLSLKIFNFLLTFYSCFFKSRIHITL